jgi:hypothetical protein
MTGAPHAIDSIITSPNGSSHSIGKSVARACWSSSTFSPCVTSPHVLDPVGEVRPHEVVEVLLLERLAHFPASLSRQAALRSPQRWPRWAPLSASSAREEEVVAALRPEGVDGQVERIATRRDPGEVGLRLALVVGDGNQRRIGSIATICRYITPGSPDRGRCTVVRERGQGPSTTSVSPSIPCGREITSKSPARPRQ